MGVQGNYPGSGAINQHKRLAMSGEAPGATDNKDTHLHEGGSDSGIVGGVNMGSTTDLSTETVVGGVNMGSVSRPAGGGHVFGNAP